MTISDTYLLVFVGLLALAMLIQSIAVIGMFLTFRRLSARVEEVSSEVQRKIVPLSEKMDHILVGLQSIVGNVEKIQGQFGYTGEIIQNRMMKIDGLLESATHSAQDQIVRIQDVMAVSTQRMEETFDMIQKGLVAPLSEVTALIRGVKVGLGVILRGGRSPAEHSHQDEEMFI